jgi:Skp family chaperone for outer membrane proteins
MTIAFVIACVALFATVLLLGLANTDRRLLRESRDRYRADYLAEIERNRELRAEQLDDIKRRTASFQATTAQLRNLNNRSEEN